MVDIEATGIDWHKEDLLQLAVLEVDYDFKSGWWVPGKYFQTLQFTNRQPTSEFAKEHLAALYQLCNHTQPILPETLRSQLLNFFRSCGTKGVEDTFLMGWNASNFDIPFLVHKGVLVPSSYVTGPDGKDRQEGDFHYRIYEIGGAIQFAIDVTGGGIQREELLKLAREGGSQYRKEAHVPQKDHDALFDCYDQLDLVNGLISFVEDEVGGKHE